MERLVQLEAGPNPQHLKVRLDCKNQPDAKAGVESLDQPVNLEHPDHLKGPAPRASARLGRTFEL
jgi:hypothetical protein